MSVGGQLDPEPVRCVDDSHSDLEPAASLPRPPPGALDVSIRRRGNVVELSLSGDLDKATAPRLGEAMALVRNMTTSPRPSDATASRRRGHGHAAIVIDTSDVDFVDAAGYQALQAALVGPNGLWDPRVVWILGRALASFEASDRAASAPSAQRREAAGRRLPSAHPSL